MHDSVFALSFVFSQMFHEGLTLRAMAVAIFRY
jgi:hypothetical protein